MRHLDIFSGIGGFALAASWVWGDDHEIVAFCEKDEYCQKVLAKHWPGVPVIGDIRDVTDTNIGRLKQGHNETRRQEGTESRGRSEQSKLAIDLITGGFPCQPFSAAGKRNGRSDDRHLWPEMLRVIRAIRPRWVIAENVRGILSIEDGMVFEQVCLDMESEDYDVQAVVVPAVAVDAHHRRDRVWFVGHTGEAISDARGEGVHERGVPKDAQRENGESGGVGADGVPDGGSTAREAMANPECNRRKQNAEVLCRGEPIAAVCSENDSHSLRLDDDDTGSRAGKDVGQQCAAPEIFRDRRHWLPEPGMGRVANGVPKRVDRLRALGNAIVPQVAQRIMEAIKATDMEEFTQ